VLEPPIPLPTYPEEAYWHERFDADPAHRWLRTLVQAAARPLGVGGRPQRRGWDAPATAARRGRRASRAS